MLTLEREAANHGSGREVADLAERVGCVTPQPLGEAHVWRVDIDQAKLRVRNVPEAMRDARRRRHEASGAGPEDIIPDLKLGLACEHIERVDVVVVSMRINSVELGAKAELDDLELRKLPENPVMSLPAHDLFPAFRAERDDAVHGHVASLSDRPASGRRAAQGAFPSTHMECGLSTGKGVS